MGLFTNKKKLCPICDSPTPRLFPTVVDGMPICKECKKKIHLPDGALDSMPLDDFRQYMAFHQKNQPLRDSFAETFSWGPVIHMDTGKKLFRLGDNAQGLVMEAVCLKGFRILEDDKVLFESSPDGVKCYQTDTLSRAEAMEPVVAQFNMQREQYDRMEEMKERMTKENKDSSSSFSYMSRPSFDTQLIKKGFTLEVTLEHPYWDGEHRMIERGPQFDNTYPSVSDFMRKYQQETEVLHTLAVNLMAYIHPDAPEIPVSAGTAADSAASRSLPVSDPVVEIQRYKALLDSGVLTEEEFAAKKRQILGI